MFTTLVTFTLAIAQSFAGYGDVDEDGYPSWEERDLHLWTNAVRVDPGAYEDEYEYAGCTLDDFEKSEKTPQSLLYLNENLNEAARYHSQDMSDNNWFDHDSSDGTSFYERLSWFYKSSYVGENIAAGYSSPYTAIMHGWMCSSGHRSNIMWPDFNELGTGIVGTYYTQDFGVGTIGTSSPIAMCSHLPENPTGDVTFRCDWEDAEAPGSLSVVLDGSSQSMSLEVGASDLGVYASDAEIGGGECVEYYFSYTMGDGTSGTFPEEGSYLAGGSCSNSLMWVEDQQGSDGDAGIGEGGIGGDGAVAGGDIWFGDGRREEEDGDNEVKIGGCSVLGSLTPVLPRLLIVFPFVFSTLVTRRRQAG